VRTFAISGFYSVLTFLLLSEAVALLSCIDFEGRLELPISAIKDVLIFIWKFLNKLITSRPIAKFVVTLNLKSPWLIVR